MDGSGGGASFTYDMAGNRLRIETRGGASQEFEYDAAENIIGIVDGNRIRRVADGVEKLYRYDPRNRLTQLSRGGVVTPFRYDNGGNLLADDKALYSYDAFNRTTKVETIDGNVQINRYDAEGLRHELEENGRLVQFIFSNSREVVAEQDENKWTLYIRASSLLASSTDHARTYYHYASDEMGSTTHIVDNEGAVQNRYVYDAWGNVTEQTENVPNRFKFNGQQLDPITQQYYLRARFYNPVIARFTQEDTYRGDGLNLYAYCANNPVVYEDPTGHNPNCVKDIAKKLIEQGVPKEIAYRQAYADLINRQLADPNISAEQKALLLDKLSKTTNMSRISDQTLIDAANSLHNAQYDGMPGIGARNPVSVTIGSDGTVVVTKNNSVIANLSREQARLIFGDNVVIPAGRGVQYDNSGNPVQTNEPKHAEARGYQGILDHGGEGSLSGARQATTLPSSDAHIISLAQVEDISLTTSG